MLLAACILLGCAGAPGAETQDRFPSRQEILAVMHRVNDWQFAHPAVPAEDGRNWERGTWYIGVMSAWKETRDEKFLNQALAWGRQHKWQVGTEPGGANRLFCSETWLELFEVTHDRATIQPTIDWLDTRAPNTPAGAKRWYLEAYDVNLAYVDSLFGSPALAMLAKATGNPKYLDILQAFILDVTTELHDRESGLFYRDKRFIGRKTANGRKVLWSRGNGWLFAALPRNLENVPHTYPDRSRYEAIFKRMASALVKRQGADGLWRANLDDPQDVREPETSGTGFFCYGLAWGINHGILDRATYLPAVLKAWTGLLRNVAPDGQLLKGQQVDFQPNAVKSGVTREYSTGAFLMAASQVYKLSGTK